MEDIEAWEAELDSIHSIMRNYLEDKKTLTARVDKVAAAGDTDLTDLRIYFIKGLSSLQELALFKIEQAIYLQK